MADQVPDEVKRERIERLVEVVQRIARERNEERVGLVEQVLVEGPSRTDPRSCAAGRGGTRPSTSPARARTGRPGRRPHRRRDFDDARVAPSSPQLQPERTLRWEGCCNIRDLGRPAARGRRRDALRRVVRADDVSAAVGDGLERRRRLRRPTDRRPRGTRTRPYEPPVETSTSRCWTPRGIPRWTSSLERGVDDPRVASRRELPLLPRALQPTVRRGGPGGRGPGRGPVLVHCAAAVDRTGLVAALILRPPASASTHRRRLRRERGNWAPPSLSGSGGAGRDRGTERRSCSSVMRRTGDARRAGRARARARQREGVPRAPPESSDEALDRLRARLRG